jgi:hypothetical protein
MATLPLPVPPMADAPMDVDGARADRFVLKKWQAVALWSWDLQVDTCAICRNHIMVRRGSKLVYRWAGYI